MRHVADAIDIRSVAALAVAQRSGEIGQFRRDIADRLNRFQKQLSFQRLALIEPSIRFLPVLFFLYLLSSLIVFIHQANQAFKT